MKKFFLFITLLLFIYPLGAKGETTDASLSTYLQGCAMMTRAIESHDATLLRKAMEAFDLSGVSPGDPADLEISKQGDGRPQWLFTADFADELLLNDFQLAKIDQASLLRLPDDGAPMLVYHIFLSPGEQADISFSASGEMTVAATSGSDILPDLTVMDASGSTITSGITDSSESAVIARWPEGASSFIRISNPSSSAATFALIFN